MIELSGKDRTTCLESDHFQSPPIPVLDDDDENGDFEPGISHEHESRPIDLPVARHVPIREAAARPRQRSHAPPAALHQSSPRGQEDSSVACRYRDGDEGLRK